MTDHRRDDRERSPPAADRTDAALTRAIAARDEVALAALYDRYGGLVYTLALRIVGDRELAEEILQDVFLRCWDRATSFQPERGGVSAWLLGITRNRAIDLLRGRVHQARLREQERLPTDEALMDATEADVGDVVALRETVRVALHALPPEQRLALELAYYGGLPQAEIARLLGEPLGTVKTRMRAGVERLRRLLQPLVEPALEEGRRRGRGP